LNVTPRPPVAARAMYPDRTALAPRSKNASTARTRTSPTNDRATRRPSVATPAAAVSHSSTSRGPRTSPRWPSGTWQNSATAAATARAAPTWVGVSPTTWVKYRAEVVMSAPLPIVFTNVATARTRSVGSTGTPRRVSRLLFSAVVIACRLYLDVKIICGRRGWHEAVRPACRALHAEGFEMVEKVPAKPLRDRFARAYKYPHATGSPEADRGSEESSSLSREGDSRMFGYVRGSNLGHRAAGFGRSQRAPGTHTSRGPHRCRLGSWRDVHRRFAIGGRCRPEPCRGCPRRRRSALDRARRRRQHA
jgi:hypothetical protein